MTRIKICGLTRPEDVRYVNTAKPDWCGFILNFPSSRRNVTPEQARALRAGLDPDIRPVGVFVDRPVEEVAALLNSGVISVAQLHGREDNAYISVLRTLAPGCVVWRAFQLRSQTWRRPTPQARIWCCWITAGAPARPSTGPWRGACIAPSCWREG